MEVTNSYFVFFKIDLGPLNEMKLMYDTVAEAKNLKLDRSWALGETHCDYSAKWS